LRLGEGPRWALAFLGLPLWLWSSLLPTLSGPADYQYRCGGRPFTDSFDDCFYDGIPVLEMMAPLAAMLFAYPFARFAFSIYAPHPAARRLKWRLATRSDPGDLWPTLHIFGLLGAAWAAWRLLTDPLDPRVTVFQVFWSVFALWFLGGVVAALADPATDGD
jgi:hypothetical protein